MPCRVNKDLKAEREAAKETASVCQAEVTSLEQQLATSQADLEAEQSLKTTLQADVQDLQASPIIALQEWPMGVTLVFCTLHSIC